MVNRLHAALVLAFLLAGCSAADSTTAPRWDRGFFACSSVGGPGGGGDGGGGDGGRKRVVGIFPDPKGEKVSLNLGHGQVQTLSLVQSATGRFYSNALWAWKPGNAVAYLTDIQDINVQPCRPVDPANGLDAVGST